MERLNQYVVRRTSFERVPKREVHCAQIQNDQTVISNQKECIDIWIQLHNFLLRQNNVFVCPLQIEI